MTLQDAIALPYDPPRAHDWQPVDGWLSHWTRVACALDLPLGELNPKGRTPSGQLHMYAVYYVRERLKLHRCTIASIPKGGFHRAVVQCANTGEVRGIYDGRGQLDAFLIAFSAENEQPRS